MRLTTLTLTNFRACRDTTVRFAPDLTVLVGENASGKSAVIDALRLATFPASGRSTMWFSADRDLSRSVDVGEPVVVSARYGDLAEVEKAVYLAELMDHHEDLIYTASFATSADTPTRSVLSWSVGESLAEDPEPALRRRISHVYLPPLRDAVRDLDGPDQAQLHDVLRLLTSDDEAAEADFVGAANEALKAIAAHPLATSAREAIQGFFSKTTPPNREHTIDLNQRELELRRIARLLRIQLAERGVPVGDIASTGLGYANLLYISMIVLQLVRAKESDLTLLLVEEPEAHLHPQLQLVLLEFLHDQAVSSGVLPDDLRPAGKVQVVVTTHSPVLASTVSINKVVVLGRAEKAGAWSTKATALSDLGLTEPETRKIDRYLNATRAALLFARDIVLVEGIAESLLLPALARRHFESSLNAEAAKRAIRQFASASLVSVEGVDFLPYLRLLLAGNPRVDRVVVVTDRDHTGAGDKRKQDYEHEFADAVAAGRLIVQVGGTTLEAELFRESGNEAALREAFLTIRPGSETHWTKVTDAAEDASPDERAELFAKAIRAVSPKEDFFLDISKGEFAHLVAESITLNGRDVVIPGYLKQSAEAVAHVTTINSDQS